MTASLYVRLGQSEGIAKIVADVIDAHLQNPLVQKRFEHAKDIDHAKKMAHEFFCAGSGGPEHYSGKDMLSAHAGMNISEQEYMAVMDDIMIALQNHAIDEATQKDVLFILFGLKNDIIHV